MLTEAIQKLSWSLGSFVFWWATVKYGGRRLLIVKRKPQLREPQDL